MDVNIVSRAAGGTGAGAPARRPKTPTVAGSGEDSGAAGRSGGAGAGAHATKQLAASVVSGGWSGGAGGSGIEPPQPI